MLAGVVSPSLASGKPGSLRCALKPRGGGMYVSAITRIDQGWTIPHSTDSGGFAGNFSEQFQPQSQPFVHPTDHDMVIIVSARTITNHGRSDEYDVRPPFPDRRSS
jgi:hypothetical protein